jgi:hypothetical protein
LKGKKKEEKQPSRKLAIISTAEEGKTVLLIRRITSILDNGVYIEFFFFKKGGGITLSLCTFSPERVLKTKLPFLFTF